MKTIETEKDTVRSAVREHYGKVATREGGCGCGPPFAAPIPAPMQLNWRRRWATPLRTRTLAASPVNFEFDRRGRDIDCAPHTKEGSECG